MKNIFKTAISAIMLILMPGSVQYYSSAVDFPSVYTFSAKTIDGAEKSLRDYEGKILLIVNVASKCGYTPQYEGLQKLYDKYKDKGFEILAFPCNQFRNQEPGTPEEIENFCKVNYGVNFTLFDKIDVNGENAHDLYKYLTESGGELKPIEWNFTKFLIGKDGRVISRFSTKIAPEEIAADIEKALSE